MRATGSMQVAFEGFEYNRQRPAAQLAYVLVDSERRWAERTVAATSEMARDP